MANIEPAFKPVFGEQWKDLPPVFLKRYANKPFSTDIATVEGKMEISFSKLMYLFIPMFRLFKVLVPYQGKNIPVHVDFCSSINSPSVALKRKFYFPDKKVYEFNSYMHVLGMHDVIEVMKFGLGWRTQYFYYNNKIIMQHQSYVIRVFGRFIPLPLEWFIGKGYAEEQVIDDNSYRVTMTITHLWFGRMYDYAGDFIFTRTS